MKAPKPQPPKAAPEPVPALRKVQVCGLLRWVPGCWEQLHGTPYVRVQLARLVPHPERRRLAITMALLKVHPLHDWRMWWTWKTKLTAHEMGSLLQLADPFVDLQPVDRWLLPTLRIKRRWLKLVCGTRLLDHLGAEHWGEVDGHFMRWQQTRDFDCLRHMAALLYAPEKATLEQLREGLSIPYANAMPERYLLAIGANWGQTRAALEKVAPNVFSGKRVAKARSGGWGQVLMAYSGGRLGTWSETRNTPIRAFMANMDLVIAEYHRLKNRKQA